MIRVRQSGVMCPAIFDPDGDAAKETERAVAFYTSQEGAEAVEFKVYSHKAVKEALTRLFKGKCAYCESRFDATQPVDIEHWRPKGDVEEEIEEADAQGRLRTRTRKRGRGYYWLAAAWNNLLPSCIDCNRRRTQKLLPDGEERVIGKGNFFPLKTGCVRADCQGEEAGEEPLLLNPYHDDPSLALAFGDECELRPRSTDGKTADDPRALVSIQVYALNRSGLVLARMQMLFEMRQHMHVFRQLTDLMKDPLAEHIKDVLFELLRHESEVLQGYTDSGRPYSFCAREALNRFEMEMGLPVSTWPDEELVG
jgi:hypothetical protein